MQSGAVSGLFCGLAALLALGSVTYVWMQRRGLYRRG